MPPKSVIQSQLKDHKDWLLELCQDPLMTVAKIQTKLHEKTGIKARYVLPTIDLGYASPDHKQQSESVACVLKNPGTT